MNYVQSTGLRGRLSTVLVRVAEGLVVGASTEKLQDAALKFGG